MENQTMRDEIKKIAEKYNNEVNLIDMVHNFLAEENQANQVKRVTEGRIGKFYPSSVGRCNRQVAYQMLGYPGKPIPGRNLLIMDNGTYFHERMEHTFKRMGIMIAPELKLTHDELRISGRSDAIVWNWLKKEPVENDTEIELTAPDGSTVYKGPQSDVLIVELKSINNKNYEKLPKTLPKMEHRMQLQLYMYLTGIRQGVVYYENKDTQEQKYFYVEYNPNMVEEIITDIRTIIRHLDAGTLPEREYQPVSFECRFCDYRDMCHPLQSSYNLNDVI
jgi:CRISPR/Cas system-associated exonuclease Cas4 (RecB family)